MTRALHLEGMGVMGSLIAHQLAARGINFTWHDMNHYRNSWQACTGVIYPSGVKIDNDNYARWSVSQHEYTRWWEAATFCFYSKNAPHNGRSQVKFNVGGVKVSDGYTYHINAQQLVLDTRNQFTDGHRNRRQVGRLCIVTHGFYPYRIGKWSWGWSTKVRLRLAPPLEALHFRPSLYMRDGHVLDYLYPVPGQPEMWYAGTSLITQLQPRSLLIEPKYTAWHERMVRKAGDAFVVLDREELREGWRPMPKPDTPLVERVGNTVYIRAQYGSGIRHFWTLWDKLEGYVT